MAPPHCILELIWIWCHQWLPWRPIGMSDLMWNASGRTASTLVQLRLCAEQVLKHYLTQQWHIVDWTQGTNFSEISTKIHKFSFTKINLKMFSAKFLPFCSVLNMIIQPNVKNLAFIFLSTISICLYSGWSNINISAGNGLVLSGSKVLPEAMLIKINVTICHHKATMS